MTRPPPARNADLTGFWSGEYWYAGVALPTPFSAHITDTAGNITGSTLEPFKGQELSATLNGARGELSVRFTKLYRPAPGVHRLPIFYSGAVDPNFTMIDGDWTFNAPDTVSGRFVLVRVSGGAKAATVKQAATLSVR